MCDSIGLAAPRTLRTDTGVDLSLPMGRGCTRKCACLSVLGLCLLSSTLKFCGTQKPQERKLSSADDQVIPL